MLRTRLPLALLLAVLAFVSACSRVTDDSITTDIRAKMFSEPLLKSARVDVTSKDGIVTITGLVPDDAARVAPGASPPKPRASSRSSTRPPWLRLSPRRPTPFLPLRNPSRPRSSSQARAQEKTHSSAGRSQPSPTDITAASNALATPPVPATPAVAAAPAPPPTPPPPPPPQPITVTIPDGSIVTVRIIDAFDSKEASAGQSFRASLNAPVVVEDQVVLPKGLKARLRIVNVSSAGKIKGQSELTVSLDSATCQGRSGGDAVLGALIGTGRRRQRTQPSERVPARVPVPLSSSPPTASRSKSRPRPASTSPCTPR
jgi:BON domain